MYSVSLWIKARLVGTPIENWAKRVRWLGGVRQRMRHPELWELYLEDQRFPLALNKIIQSTSCCIDVGAHIGSFLSLLMHYAPKGRHIAVEPSPVKAKWLHKRFPAVTVLEAAISDENGYAPFQEEERSGYSHLAATETSTSYNVRTHRLDDLPIERVDFLKLDIEGAELRALRGSRRLITRWQPAILFECGHEYPPMRTDRIGTYRFLTEDLDYNVYTLADFLYEKGPLTLDEFRKCGLYPFRAFNYLALPKRLMQCAKGPAGSSEPT
jgi:FkbM family methyltransferase